MSSTELTLGDLDRVKVILSQLNCDEVYHSSRLEKIRVAYEKHMKNKLPKLRNAKWSTSKIYADTTTMEIIEGQNLAEFLPVNTKPARVTSNGNCLYNAVSLFLVENESLSIILRLLTSIELYTHHKYYISSFKHIWEKDGREFVNELSFFKSIFPFETGDIISNMASISKAFRYEAVENCFNYRWSSLPCVAALSSVIRYSINSVYSQRKELKLFPIFTRKFIPREKHLDINEALYLIWTNTSKHDTSSPNHFTVSLSSTIIKDVDFGNSKQFLSEWLVSNKSGSSASTPSTVPLSPVLSFALPNTSLHRKTKQTKLNFILNDPLSNSTRTHPISTSATSNLTDRPSSSTLTDRPSTSTLADQPSTSTLTDRPSTSIRTDAEQIKRGDPIMNATQCDPNDIGLHYQNINTLSDTEKYELLKNIWKPPPQFTFPKHFDSNRHWTFQRKYIDPTSKKYFPWLAYSAYLDGALCVPCVFFGHSYESHGLTKLYSEPFTRWNGAPTRWKKHHLTEVMSMHQSAMLAYQTFVSQMQGVQKKVDNIHITLTRKQIAENRKKLMPLLRTIVLCGQQNIALRGHRDRARDLDVKGLNCGNYQALLNFRIEAGDKILDDHFKTAPKNATYRSPTIQNEMIICCKKYIQQILVAEIKGKHFSVMADEAIDVSNKEQLSLVIRFIDDKGEIREEFIAYLLCPSLKGDDIACLILETVKNLGLDMNMCRGQCYDGAGNMAGVRMGCAAYIKILYPKALYFHCSSHRLNLIVAESCRVVTVRNMMDTMKKCSDVFHFSPKKEGLLEKCIEEEIPRQKQRKLFDVCRTRWILRLDEMERFQELLTPILCALELISNDGSYKSDARSDANGLLHRISTFDFIINLIVVRHVLSYVRPLTTELQQVKLDIAAVYEAVDTDLAALKECRKDIDVKYKEWFDVAVELCKAHVINVTMPRVAKMQIHRENHPANSVEEYYKRSMVIPLLDTVINEFEERFSKEHRAHGNAFYVIPSKVMNDKQWRKRVEIFAKSYEDDLPNFLGLSVELDLWEIFWIQQYNQKQMIPDNMRDTLRQITQKRNWFPNINCILELVGCVPGTSNSCERSISKLRLLKTYLRSTMGQDRLNGLALLSVHRDINIDFEKLLNIFATDFSHRLRLIDILDNESV